MKKSTKRFVLSDESKNLHGFVTVTAGIDLSDFDNNPVMLYDHDYGKLIGQWTDYRVEGTKLTGAPMFDEDDPFAMQQYSKVEQGILKGASIGIAPVQFDEANSRMEQSSLKEVSLTPVPSNRKALSIALYSPEGIKLSDAQAKEYLLSLKPQTADLTNTEIMDKKLLAALIVLSAQAGLTITLSDKSSTDDLVDGLKLVGEKITGLSSKNNELTTKLNGIELAAKAEAEKELKTVLDTAQEQKLLTAETRPGFEALGKIDLSALKTTLSAMKPVTLVEVPKPEEKKVVGRDAWTYDDYALSAPSDLEKMQATDPTKFQKLLSAKVAKARGEHSIEV